MGVSPEDNNYVYIRDYEAKDTHHVIPFRSIDVFVHEIDNFSCEGVLNNSDLNALELHTYDINQITNTATFLDIMAQVPCI